MTSNRQCLQQGKFQEQQRIVTSSTCCHNAVLHPLDQLLQALMETRPARCYRSETNLSFKPSHQQKSDVFGPPGIYWFLWKSSLHNQHLPPCSDDWPCMRKRWNKLIQKVTSHLKLFAVTLHYLAGPFTQRNVMIPYQDQHDKLLHLVVLQKTLPCHQFGIQFFFAQVCHVNIFVLAMLTSEHQV